MKNLVDLAKQDVLDFLRTNQELFFNERDFQMHLATFLRLTNNYDDVDVEYYVPVDKLNYYPWVNLKTGKKSELRLDILVRRNEEYLPIELKYKTKNENKDIPRFGEILYDVEVLKNQAAQNLGMYDFWKDVKRIELIREKFKNVHSGLAIFLTNDPLYTQKSNEKASNFLFNMNEGPHPTQKHWGDEKIACAKGHPSFDVEKEYSIHWDTKQIEDVDFYYCIVTV